MKVEFLDSIEDISKEDWDGNLIMLIPFLKYEFLKCLEIQNAFLQIKVGSLYTQ